MPEARNATPVIALAMLISALALAVAAVLIYSGVISLGDELRMIAAVAVGVAAFVDFVIAVWFFRKSQSS